MIKKDTFRLLDFNKISQNCKSNSFFYEIFHTFVTLKFKL